MKGVIFLSLLLPLCFAQWTGTARTFTILNNCGSDIWVGTAGNPVPGGTTGWRQATGTTHKITVAGNSQAARIWGETGCSFDGNGNPVNCQTGTNGGENTLFEFTFGEWNNLDFVDISLVDGWNMPMTVTTDVAGASGFQNCGPIDCSSFTQSSCPAELTLKNSDGSFQFCQNQCNAINNPTLTSQYSILNQNKGQLSTCCNGGCTPTSGWPTSSNGETYYNVFKSKCTTSYAWSGDDATSVFSCSQFANYTINFCPNGNGAPASSGGGGSGSSSTRVGGCGFIGTTQDFAGADLPGQPVQYSGSDDASKDASCCSACSSTSGCQFWVRATDSNNCWLKHGFTGYAGAGNRRGNFLAGCSFIGTTQDFAGANLPGQPVQYSGVDDASKDASCCNACSSTSGCQFWVRATDSNNCWLKTGFTGYAGAGNRRGNFVAGCGFIGTVQDFNGADLPGNPVQYSGVDDASKDASCCQLCNNNAACTFWVRATDSNNCWLKTGFTGYSPASNRRGNHKAPGAGSFIEKQEEINMKPKIHYLKKALQP